MAIPATTKTYIDNLIEYYISVASSYKQFAKLYSDDTDDIQATTFGIILGCVYSGFLQSYANMKQKPSLIDIQEFHQMMKRKTIQMKKSILDAKS